MKGKFFKCEYGSEGVWIEHNKYFGTEFSLFSHNPRSNSWLDRLKEAWNCLTGKRYGDMVLLDDSALVALIDHLIDIQNNGADDDYEETVSISADKLCGVSCGTAVDAILEYVKRPDCSRAQAQRLIDELNKV